MPQAMHYLYYTPHRERKRLRIGSINERQFFRNLTAAGGRISSAMEKLSSGQKVSRAGQDPSAHGIINTIKSEKSGLTMAERNIQDGLSFLQMRDSATQKVGDILVRLRDLAVRSANSATLNDKQRSEMQEEATALVNEINRINDASRFNNMKVFNLNFATVPGYGGPFDTSHPGQVSMSVDLASLAAQNGGVVNIYASWYDGFAAFPDLNLVSPDGTEAFGYLYSTYPPGGVETYLGGGGAQSVSGAPVDSATQVDYSGWGGYVGAGGWDEESFTLTNPAAGSWTIIIDNEQVLDITFGIFFNEPAVEPQDKDNIQIAPNTNSDAQYSLGFYEVDSVALGINANVSTATDAEASISSLDSSLQKLANRQVEDGARINELQRMLNENSVQTTNMSDSQSRLQDTDYADEITSMTKSVITAQSATAMISHEIDRLKTAAGTLLAEFS